MSEKPILFSGPMVRAILAGRKTMTRRVLNDANHAEGMCLDRIKDGRAHFSYKHGGINCSAKIKWPVGTRLWVREAWRTIPDMDFLAPRDLPQTEPILYDASTDNVTYGKLRPGMFMPRWVSRITLEVTAVKVERLQDISEEDIEAEGTILETRQNDMAPYLSAFDGKLYITRRAAWMHGWQSINGPGSWEANPWAVAYSFKVITTPDRRQD